MTFAAPNDRAASSRGDLTPCRTEAPAAKRFPWRCRFCRIRQLVSAGLVRCVACRQETEVAAA